jgi:hypothetical protein
MTGWRVLNSPVIHFGDKKRMMNFFWFAAAQYIERISQNRHCDHDASEDAIPIAQFYLKLFIIYPFG